MLTSEQRAEFDDLGFVKLPQIIEPAIANAAAEEIWRYLESNRGVDRNDRTTWGIEGPWLGLKSLRDTNAFLKLQSARLEAAIDDLLGEDRWTRLPHWGGFLVNFPDRPVEDWKIPTSSWHCDFQLNYEVGSRFGIQVFVYLNAVDAKSGGTLIIPGSHRLTENFVATLTEDELTQKYGKLRDRFHETDPWLHSLNSGAPLSQEQERRYLECEHEIDGVKVRLLEMCGEPGDAFLVHPWMIHMAAPNAGQHPRFVLRRNIQAK